MGTGMAKQGQWHVAGSAAEVYEHELVPAVFGPWASLVVEAARPRPGDHALDVACGTGIVARHLAERVGASGAVVGVDLNPGMLKVAEAAWSTSAHPGVPVRWQEASADKLPFPDGSFDVACCQLGLQFFADRAGALRDMRRVLGADGRLALMVWRAIDECLGFAILADSLERNVGPAAAAIMRAPFALSNADELTALVTSAGFQDVAIERRVGSVRFPSIGTFVINYVAGSPLAGQISQTGEALGPLIADLTSAFSNQTAGRELTFPITAHLLRARV